MNPTNFKERIESTPDNIEDDVVISFDYSSITNYKEVKSFIENIQDIIHQNDVGVFEYAGFKINIKQKIDISNTFKRNGNVDLLLNDRQFTFE